MRLAGGQELSCSALAGDVDAFLGMQQQSSGSSSRGDAAASGGAGMSSVPGGGSIGSAISAGGSGVPNRGSAVARAVAITDGPLQQVPGMHCQQHTLQNFVAEMLHSRMHGCLPNRLACDDFSTIPVPYAARCSSSPPDLKTVLADIRR